MKMMLLIHGEPRGFENVNHKNSFDLHKKLSEINIFNDWDIFTYWSISDTKLVANDDTSYFVDENNNIVKSDLANSSREIIENSVKAYMNDVNQDNYVIVWRDKNSERFGKNLQSAFQYAIDNRYDLVFYTRPDFKYEIEDHKINQFRGDLYFGYQSKDPQLIKWKGMRDQNHIMRNGIYNTIPHDVMENFVINKSAIVLLNEFIKINSQFENNKSEYFPPFAYGGEIFWNVILAASLVTQGIQIVGTFPFNAKLRDI